MKESELHAETMLQNLVRLGSDGKWDTKVYNNIIILLTTHKDSLESGNLAIHELVVCIICSSNPPMRP